MKLVRVPAFTVAQTQRKEKGAVVLLSGGLDSATCLYIAKKEYEKLGYKKLPIVALSFDYNQKHKFELKCSRKLTKILNIEHRIQKIDPHFFLGSSLTDPKIPVRKNPKALIKKINQIPQTYVPGRNILFLSFALSLAEGLVYSEIFIGVNALDYSGYPDCRPEFISKFQEMSNIGTKVGPVNSERILLRTPLLHKTKKEIVEIGVELGVPFKLTHSCYEPTGNKPCGLCDACFLRQKGFLEAGVMDR